MNNKLFPRTLVGGVSLSRMIIGSNWLLGYSHTGAAADTKIKEMHSSKEPMMKVLERYLDFGIDTIMAPFGGNVKLLDAIKDTEQKLGKKIIMIDTPIIDIEDSYESRIKAEKTIKQSYNNGATFCFPHHSSVEQLVDKGEKCIHRLPEYLQMIRENDMIPGLSAHMPEIIIYSDLNDYDVESYIQIYNSVGFLMQLEVEYINKIIHEAKKPVMTIKSMAAGRVTPFVGLTFSWNTIRAQDMVTVGCMTPQEVEEDVEISLAAIEHRRPILEGRNSPNKTDIMK